MHTAGIKPSINQLCPSLHKTICIYIWFGISQTQAPMLLVSGLWSKWWKWTQFAWCHYWFILYIYIYELVQWRTCASASHQCVNTHTQHTKMRSVGGHFAPFGHVSHVDRNTCKDLSYVDLTWFNGYMTYISYSVTREIGANAIIVNNSGSCACHDSSPLIKYVTQYAT